MASSTQQYSVAQIEAAKKAQITYRTKVREAWKKEKEAAKARVKAVNAAEVERDERLAKIGVNVNDMRDIQED